MRSVSVLAYDGMTAFEAGIVIEVFGLTWPDIEQPWYELKICTETPAPVRVIGGATMTTPYGLAEFAAADTVVVPSVADPRARTSPELIDALRRAHSNGSRIVSICSGAFALAAAGLLDGRRATTHWRYADLLRERYPSVEVDPDPLYTDEGDILTSAGCAAGLDLALHLVRNDLGSSVANAVARRLVIQPHRAGGQAQYIESPMPPEPGDAPIARSLSWALEHLADPIGVPDLARVASLSPRTYLRHFVRETGTTPSKWLIAQRIQAALAMLESGDAPIEEIATAAGFATPVTFRHHFTRAVRTSPSSYRRTFRTRKSPPPA
ncbi:GlxA family transcriptional regulator [Nocardia fluminea]|uniref:AraC family transcriptional regulator with amidase-like domain n=1 Tax=Nocardia fluminea TaxID=134984 RepID=A0A2N3V9Z2_9NOCA|nr:helix-turn-helix domain-containing protein [Nocardia fluminea]PKV78433.1 AraC family transcriptional regulator with amidase-like domain [Nocardia fluminea]